MGLRVLAPGLYTLIVDLGRPRSRSLGVPVGGAADRTSLILGNALVGNLANCAALEISLAGPTLQANGELACVLYGAPFTLTASEHARPESLTAGKTFTLRHGEELHVGGTTTGMRAYLCIRGGIQAPTILGSRSGLEPIRSDQELSCPTGTIRPRSLNRPAFRLYDPQMLRVIPGAQADWFGAEVLYTETFTITPASDRMGLRLQGDPLLPLAVASSVTGPEPEPVRELVSEPVCPGAVQVTRDGQCIILGVDGQTIGGYPKIAHVISADLDKVGQLRPGQRLRFLPVTLTEAELAYREQQAELGKWVSRLRATVNG